jgi:membrane peptidoglycan carboxypeptidase
MQYDNFFMQKGRAFTADASIAFGTQNNYFATPGMYSVFELFDSSGTLIGAFDNNTLNGQTSVVTNRFVVGITKNVISAIHDRYLTYVWTFYDDANNELNVLSGNIVLQNIVSAQKRQRVCT